jgi:hypothetical protein
MLIDEGDKVLVTNPARDTFNKIGTVVKVRYAYPQRVFAVEFKPEIPPKWFIDNEIEKST